MSLRKEIRENPAMGYILYTRLICPLKSFLNQKLIDMGETNIKIDDFYDEDEIFKFVSDNSFTAIKNKHNKNKKSKLPWNQVKKCNPAYIHFTLDMRKKMNEENPSDKSVCKQSKILGEMWRNASPEIREKYQAIADADKERYIKQRDEVIAEYNRHRIAKPKKPVLPWIFFMKNNRNRNLAGDSSKRKGVRTMVAYQELYKSLSEEEKAVYIDMANKDKARYLEERELYLEQVRQNRKNKIGLDDDTNDTDDDHIIDDPDEDIEDIETMEDNEDNEDDGKKVKSKKSKTLNLKMKHSTSDEEDLELME
jgi:structure-specific recognition protein 1